ncbi:MAG: hypothetical protein ACJAXH_001263, partial [Colwellia sp.]
MAVKITNRSTSDLDKITDKKRAVKLFFIYIYVVYALAVLTSLTINSCIAIAVIKLLTLGNNPLID